MSAKKETKKHVQVKTSFTSPFSSKWSQLPQNDMYFILKTLMDKLTATGLMKKEVKTFRPWRRKKEKSPQISTSEILPQAGRDERGCNPIRNAWMNVAARRQLAIGINEVTKALERNQLQLLLVCKSVRPQHMTDHLIALSATRGVPTCQVPRLSESMSGPLGLKSVLALGFRQCSPEDGEMFKDVVDAIKPRVPPLDVAWLPSMTPEHPTANMEMEEEEEEEEEEVSETKGQKRKRESESKKVTESFPLSCTLQPLKVKRIVSNPAKKRKTNKKKQPAK
ncbi:ribonuclease P protein subunit p38 [Austrofundulus limnaeus]|uniref:Ribonuclease P protein subunit p38 n=1 Tax=Austrofundulus limnaeus TaxID=52670 RepID=A0A2I4BTR9_AUSLI|nr:PREDICTED: ribonuclease P protein subunit p38 [Austrofundulus limnaeus]